MPDLVPQLMGSHPLSGMPQQCLGFADSNGFSKGGLGSGSQISELKLRLWNSCRFSGCIKTVAQLQYRLHQACGLPERQAKQVFKGQTKLDSSIREPRASPGFAAGSGKPGHALVQPN